MNVMNQILWHGFMVTIAPMEVTLAPHEPLGHGKRTFNHEFHEFTRMKLRKGYLVLSNHRTHERAPKVRFGDLSLEQAPAVLLAVLTTKARRAF